MQRALFFPHHTEQGCDDSWYKPDSGCLRCKALKKDLDDLIAEATAQTLRNRVAVDIARLEQELVAISQTLNPP